MSGVQDEPGRVSVGGVTRLLEVVGVDNAKDAPSVRSLLAQEPVSSSDLEEIEEAVVRLRASRSRWRRREQELSAILSGVRELGEVRDVDQLLDRLVGRARELMMADVAYLTERTGDHLKVRTTSGVVAAALRGLFVPTGMGLASKIVATRSPQWTSVYQEAQDIPHEAGIDEAVADEGLVSLLGVPLLVGGEVQGALFAAYRSTYQFSADEVALLGVFADHAAVVLQTARLLENAHARADEAREATEGLQRNLAAMERASAVHEDLTSVVVRGGSSQGVAATLSSALGRRVVILDRDLRAVADAPGSGSAQEGEVTGADCPSGVEAAIGESRLNGVCVRVRSAGSDFHHAVAVVLEDRLLGALLFGPGELDLGAVERRTIERAAHIVALVTLQQDAISEAENRIVDSLVSDIVATDGEHNASLGVRVSAHGVRLSELRSVVVAAMPGRVQRVNLRSIQQLGSASIAGHKDGVLVVLSSTQDGMSLAREVRQRLVPAVTAQALLVAGPPTADSSDLAAAFGAAYGCVRLLGKLGRQDDLVDARAYEPYRSMFGSDEADPLGFIAAVIGPVLQWDERRGGDLLATLAAFVETNARPTATSRSLHVHINTVLQRLERITQLLGDGWRDPECFFRVSVAVRLHALAAPR